jgi:c-di-GMP-binding flagellar brake protein YcgR
LNSVKGGTGTERSPLEKLARARTVVLQRHVEQLQVWFGSAQRQFPVTVYGIYPTERSLVLSAPVGADGGLVAVMRDQTMGCRWSSPIAVYTFRATVLELAFRPHPVLHAGQINSVQRFTRRQLPRVATALPATLHAGQVTEAALLTDLSAAGAQVALAKGMVLQSGQSVQLGLRLRLMDRDRILRLDCTVVTDRGEPDPEHPLVHFYGVSFAAPDETTELVLLGYTQQLMLQQGDQLGRLLQAGAAEVARRE